MSFEYVTYRCIYTAHAKSGTPRIGHKPLNRPTRKEPNMLLTIFVILLILWLLGLIAGYTMGGVIHILLVIAIVVVLVRVIRGRRLW